MAEKTLVAKLSEAASKIKAVSKDGNNDFQHYTFQSEAAIKAAVKNALAETGIVIIPRFEVKEKWTATTNRNKTANFVDVMGAFTITDGKESIEGTMPGCGQDSGEKAVTKACTTAQKYFYKQLFNISDKEEDPDATNSEPDGGFKPQNSMQPNRRQAPQQTQQEIQHDKDTTKSMNALTNSTVNNLAKKMNADPKVVQEQVKKIAAANIKPDMSEKLVATQYLNAAELLAKQYTTQK